MKSETPPASSGTLAQIANPVSLAQPIPNSQVRLSGSAPSWAEVYWLAHDSALITYRRSDNQVVWERLNVRTGSRRREQDFGSATRWHNYSPYQRHFDACAASPDGQWLLGGRGRLGKTNTVLAVHVDGHQQIWSVTDLRIADQSWLSDSSGWLAALWKDPDSHRRLWRFRIGRASPERCRLSGLPQGAWLVGTLPGNRALFSVGYLTNESESTVQADLYTVAVEDGARARRLGTVRAVGERGWFYGIALSPDGRHLLLLSDENTDQEDSTALWIGATAGGAFRKVGQTIPVASWAGSAVYGASWHPDSRRVGFFQGGRLGHQLFLARVV